MPEITVIVPIYKVEKYLHKCVDSILSQSFTDFECILVDDGSPDNCPQICEDYKQSDDRIKVIHKSNGGLSDARNVALDIAKGKYITFVDSDDWIAPNALETMREALIRTDADMAIGNMFSVTEDGIERQMDGNTDEETVFNGKEIWSTILQPCAQKKLYKVAIWNKLRFPVGRLYEDAFTYHHVLEQINRIVKTGKPTYYYLVRQGSIMHTEYNIRFTDIIDAIEDRINTLERCGLNELADRDRMFIYSQSAVALAHLDKNDEKQRKRAIEVWNVYKKNFSKLIISQRASSKEKILFTFLRIAPKMHGQLFGKKMPLNLG